MFCKKCGNEISDGVKFCKHCGSPVEEQSVQGGAKKSGNLIVRICIIAVAFLIARFVVAPIITSSYQDNGDGKAAQTEYKANGANQQDPAGNGSYDGELKTNVYEFENEGVYSTQVLVLYADGDMGTHKDGAVVSITGYMTAMDTESDAAKDFAQTQKEIEETVTNSGISDVSYRLTDNLSSYSVQFYFNDLDGEGRSEAAMLASRMLFGTNGSAGNISKVHRELLGLNYTLVNEY